LVTLGVLASCFQGGRAPAVAPQRTLELTSDPAFSGAHGPFGVTFAGPKGEADEAAQVSILFNRPMRPLELAGDESAPPARITVGGGAAPKGAWRWLGTSALTFAPEAALPKATEYVVTIPKGTRALDGSEMSADYTFSFRTPRPKLVHATPRAGETHLVPGQTWELRFNQPVDLREIERVVTVSVGSGKAARSVAVKATWPKPDTRALVKIEPVAKLPLASDVDVVLDKSLHGTEGPLPMDTEERITGRTYGPLVVEGTECWRDTPHKKCEAGGSLSLSLSNPVPWKELRAHVRVDGAALAWPATEADHLTMRPSLPLRMRAARTYQVVVTAGLKDEYGQVLARDVVLKVDTDDLWPRAEIGLEGSIMEGTRGKHEVPIGSVNAGSYQIATAPLDEATVADMLAQERRRTSFDRISKLPGAKVESVTPGVPMNAPHRKLIDLDAALANNKGRGPVALALRHPGARYGAREDARIVQVTDVGISAKMSRFGSVVWLTRLSDGKPLGGATVSVRNASAEIFSTKTDATGLATIPADKYSPVIDETVDREAIVIARSGDDWAYRAVSDMLDTWRYEPSTDVAGRLSPEGMLFTDRGVYRPGETVRVKGLFRVPLPKGTQTPAGRDVTLEAYDSQDTKLFENEAKLGAFGEVAVDVPVPATAHLGVMELRAELKDASSAPSLGGGRYSRYARSTASATVELAAYKPVEFKVGVELDKPSYVRGDKASAVARGDYLFGAPMGGAKVRCTVTRGAGSFTPPGAEGFVIDDETFGSGYRDTTPRAGQLQSGEGALDAKGSYAASTALALPGQRGPEIVSVEAEVEDVSRQTVAGRASAVVHPGEFYAAMKPPSDFFVSKGSSVHVDLAAIEPSGKRRAGVPIRVELLRRTWHTVVEASGEAGGHYESRVVDVPAGRCDATSTGDAAGCDVKIPDAGYYILHAKARDPRGNDVGSSASLYAIGDASGSIGWAESDASKLELVTDKKSYEIGDTAKILVKNPFREAEAIVTVERAGIYRQERRTLTGPMPTLSIPITEDLRPNAFVSVQLVKGRTSAAPAKGPDVGAPAFRLGYAEIIVNPEARRFKVSLSPSKKELAPGEEIDVGLEVKDRAGKPAKAEITFYAVDEGVLLLTGYKTPDPIPVFTRPRPLAVFSLESRSDMAKIVALSGAVGGDKGDEGGGGGSVREDFRATAYFQPSLVTGPDGKAKVHFKLPDSLTTYRLMAVVAGEDDRFGFGETQVVTSRPLMARPALPRFLRVGDSMVAGVVLSSKAKTPLAAEVSLDAQGVQVSGDAKRTVSLPPGGSVEVTWPIAAPAAGRATFAFHARAEGAKDDVLVTREISLPSSPEAVALYGETTQATADRLGDLASVRPDYGGLDLKVATTALVGLDDGADQLIEYPYGCAEQLSSRLLPLIPLRDLANDYGFKLPTDTKPIIDSTLAKLLLAQRPDGGFGYWPDSPSSDAWLTAYVLWTLHQAKTRGFLVPDAVMDSGARYLRHELERRDRPTWWVASAAFAVDVLATIGKPDPGYADRLFEKRAEMPLFARALLAHAMITSKMSQAQAKELVADVDNHLHLTTTGATVVDNLNDAYAPVLDSEARTTAIVLRTLVTVDRGHPLASRIARGLLGMRRGGRWRSTQETAWSLLALDEYRKAQESGTPAVDAEVFLGEARVLSESFRERTVKPAVKSLDMKQILAAGPGPTFAVQARGGGKVFYEARLRYAKKEMPAAPLDRGFFVRKTVRSVKPEALSAALGSIPQQSQSAAKAGELVLVDLVVVSPEPREQVVIDDPLPAGLEPVQTELATTASWLRGTDAGGEGDEGDADAATDDARAGGKAFSWSFYHREMHDDRALFFVEHMAAGIYHYRYLARATTPGKFVVPPTRAECMYEPETFGRTAGASFEVQVGK
jgi:hypothetical protein